MSIEIRTGKLHHVYEAGVSACLELDGIAYHPKVFRRLRRGVIVKEGQIVPGPKKTRLSVPFESGLEVVAWVLETPGRNNRVLRFTTKAQYDAALTELNR